MKTCTKCGETKPQGEYAKNGKRNGVQQYRPDCKACKGAYNAKWYRDNPESRRAYFAKYRAENAESRRDYLANWRAANRARWATDEGDLNAPKRCSLVKGCGGLKTRADFHVSRMEADGRYPVCIDCVAIRNANRGYRKECRNTHGEPVGSVCYLCTTTITADDEAHADHLIPRSRGGGDDGFNLRWTHGRCNIRRHNRLSTPGEALRLMPGLLPSDHPYVLRHMDVIAV